MADKTTTPLSFEIDADLSAKLNELRKTLGDVSFSAIIDHAIAAFDFEKIARSAGGDRRQLSVRLANDKRDSLAKLSKAEKVSIASLIRIALAALVDSAAKKTVQKELKAALAPKSVEKKTVVAKKTTKKASAKKAVKKAAVKKAAVAKKVAKKAVVKKAAAKKVFRCKEGGEKGCIQDKKNNGSESCC
jgi:hypothetical protein